MTWSPPPEDPDRELREHLPSESWAVAIARIADRHGLDAARAEPFASGSDIVWALGPWVVKLTAPRWRWQIEAEVRNLGQVRGRLPVRTPAVRTWGELAGWPYVVMERLDGIPLDQIWPALEHGARLGLAAELGHLMRALHTLPEPLGEPWEPFWLACRSNVPARHGGPGVPPELLAEIEPFLAAQGGLDDGRRALLHTELHREHLLVTEHAGRLRLDACIDFADGRPGHPLYDLAAPVELLFDAEPGLLQALLDAYAPGAPVPSPEHLLAWHLCHRYGSLPRLLGLLPRLPGSLGELARALYDGAG